MTVPTTFSADQLLAIADVLGDTVEGLTNAQIDFCTRQCGLPFIENVHGYSKKKRVFDILAASQNAKRNNHGILAFIEMACAPSGFANRREAFECLRQRLNGALSYSGLGVAENGKVVPVKQASTILEAETRANELRADLLGRGTHPDVLRFCKPELLQDNYFHAVLEATKGLAEKIRSKTGNVGDGQQLVDRAFGGDKPYWVINDFKTDSEKSEHRGFVNICKGIFGMIRNPLAHEPKLYWNIDKRDAADILSTLSLLHRRIDNAKMPPRV